MRELEKETCNLRTELQIYKTKCDQLESQFQIKEDECKQLTLKNEQMDKELTDMSKLGDQ